VNAVKIVELKQKTVKELLEELFKVKKEQMNLRFQKSAGERVNPSRIRLLRKTVARIKTVLNILNTKGAKNA
jgi:large subunit ribosomal protein L29